MATVSGKNAGGRPRTRSLSPFGKRLDALCERRGLSRADLAKKTGLNAVTIWRWMVGLTEPTLSGATKLADAAGGKLSDLLPKKAG